MEPDPRARVLKQAGARVDAIQRTRNPSRRGKAVWDLVEVPAGIGVKEVGRVPVRAKEKAVVGSNKLKKSMKEVKQCQDLIEQAPLGPDP